MDSLGFALLQSFVAFMWQFVAAVGLVGGAVLRFVAGCIGEQSPAIDLFVALGCAWFAVAALCALAVNRMAR